jgi:hypothetical protein
MSRFGRVDAANPVPRAEVRKERRVSDMVRSEVCRAFVHFSQESFYRNPLIADRSAPGAHGPMWAHARPNYGGRAIDVRASVERGAGGISIALTPSAWSRLGVAPRRSYGVSRKLLIGRIQLAEIYFLRPDPVGSAAPRRIGP